MVTRAPLSAAAWLALSSLLLTTAQAANVTLDWSVGWVNDLNLNGLGSRRAIGINGAYPPPIININQSDSLTINYRNAFGDGRATALHSHGMFFNNTAYFDGAVSVTQCPIPDGQSIAYQPHNSPLSPPDRSEQWGTYWTHGHYDGQYVDGLRTPAIIHADTEVHAYDDDYTIILADWYLREHDDLLKNEFLNAKNPTGAEPVPESGLVYVAHTPKNGEASYLPGYNDNVTIPFEAGKTYRLRMINMAALSMFHVWIEGHDMQIIEADGTDTQPSSVDVLSLAVAQRYSVLVTARNDSANNWPLHINLDPDMYDQVPAELQLNLTATVSYGEGKAMGTDPTRQTVEAYEQYHDTALVPFEVEAQLPPADVSHTLEFAFDTYSDGKNYAAFNDVSYVMALTPSLFTAVSMPSNESGLAAVYGPNSGALVAEHMSVIDITIVNTDAGNHPFHLHGHKFQLVHKSMDLTSDDPEINPPFVEGQANPIRRDTVQIPAGGSATLRLRADNPGVWFLHCHIDWHLSSGLAAILVEGVDQLTAAASGNRSAFSVPSYMTQQCTQMGKPYSGNAAGLSSTTDFAGLPAGPTHLVSGWTANAIGTFVACLITCLLGMATICWYGFSSHENHEEDEDDDDEEEESTHVEQGASPSVQRAL